MRTWRYRLFDAAEVTAGDLLVYPVALYRVLESQPYDGPNPSGPDWIVQVERIGDAADLPDIAKAGRITRGARLIRMRRLPRSGVC